MVECFPVYDGRISVGRSNSNGISLLVLEFTSISPSSTTLLTRSFKRQDRSLEKKMLDSLYVLVVLDVLLLLPNYPLLESVVYMRVFFYPSEMSLSAFALNLLF